MMSVSVNKLVRTLLMTAGIAVTLGPATATATLYKWVDEAGKVHYGDRVPPEYAKQELKTLNDQGITVDVKERAKTPEEVVEERRLARQAAEEAERRRQRAMQDRILLDTFSNEDEMIMTRDGKIEAIDAIIRVTNGRMEKMRERLVELTEDAANLERSGKPVSEKLHAQITSTKQQITDNESYIAQKKSEQQQLRERYEADIARFRELMAEKEAAEKEAAEAAASGR